jgi:L-amino acid N-acyltransferase YncA
MTVIRPATLADAEAIAHVYVEAWRTAYRGIMPTAFLDSLSKEDRRDRWQAILTKNAPREFNFVAEQDGEIVGIASGGPERKGDPDFTGELYAIYLLDEHRGHGIGTALFQRSVETLVALGIKSMKVWVLRDNPHRAFYERLGGELLLGEDIIELGGSEMVRIAYGWRRLSEVKG